MPNCCVSAADTFRAQPAIVKILFVQDGPEQGNRSLAQRDGFLIQRLLAVVFEGHRADQYAIARNGNRTDAAGNGHSGQFLVTTGREETFVVAGRVHDRCVLANGLVHRFTDGARETHFRVQRGNAGHGLNHDLVTAYEPDAYTLAAELDGQSRCGGVRGGFEVSMLDARGNQVDDGQRGRIVRRGRSTHQQFQPDGAPGECLRHCLLTSLRSLGEFDGDHADQFVFAQYRYCDDVALLLNGLRR